MFRAISHSWQLARATELRKLVDDMVRRLPALQGNARLRFAETVAEEMESLLKNTDDFKNVSQNWLKKIAKAFFSDARKSYDLDVGRGSALAMIAASVEALALPGPDAEYIRSTTKLMIHQTIEMHIKATSKSVSQPNPIQIKTSY